MVNYSASSTIFPILFFFGKYIGILDKLLFNFFSITIVIWSFSRKTMIGHSHNCCAPFPRHIFQGGQIARGGILWLGWCPDFPLQYTDHLLLPKRKEWKVEGFMQVSAWRLYVQWAVWTLSLAVESLLLIFRE